MKIKNSQAGVGILESIFASALTVVLVLGITTITQQSQKGMSTEGLRIELQQAGRLALDRATNSIRGAGSNRAGGFSSAPFTTASSLPIPSASPSSIRVRTDINDDGVISAGNEDVSITWDAATKT